MIRAGIVAVSLLLAASVADAGQPVKYVALVHGGTTAGRMVLTTGDDGATTAEFVFPAELFTEIGVKPFAAPLKVGPEK